MKLIPAQIAYRQLRHVFSSTGQWKKKINKSMLKNIEEHWAAKVLSPKVKSNVTEGNRKYILSMFPYPSGDLHMGHVRVYTISDVLARYHRLNGCQVLHPIGWDSFGLPAENAAIQRNLAPKKWTESNIEKMTGQLKDLRISFDWDKEISTCQPDYYKWTQSLFLHMYEKGLVYYSKAAVNWDPVDQTVLADEQIDTQGCSWRSGAKVEKRFLTQWYLRATNYSQSLLDGLDTLDPDSCKGFASIQRNWIKTPTGVRVYIHCKSSNDTLAVFTEEAELLAGVAFLQVSPSHFLAHQHCYDEKTGLMTDNSIINPLNSEEIPIIVKDSDKFTQKNICRFGIPCVNEDDMNVAKSLNLPYNEVTDSSNIIFNSGLLNGLPRDEARLRCHDYLKQNNLGGCLTSYDLNDWLISRQRYWGTPIPIIHCTSCGPVPVPQSHLPVTLPEISNFTGTGGNPLSHQNDWMKTSCPKCGKEAKRETDTMDTFVDSSWYFLRYTDHDNNIQPFSKERTDLFMPVNVYIGGTEHAILHMYFARFFNHFLCDLGMVTAREPFSLQLALGVVQSDCYMVADSGKYLTKKQTRVKGDRVIEKSTGKPVIHTVEKMSKSKLNGVSPQDVLSQHGVDQTRLYMMAVDDPRSNKYWNPDLVKELRFSHGKQISIPKWIHTLWHTVSIIRERRQNHLEDSVEPVPVDDDIKAVLKRSRNIAVRLTSLHLSITFKLHDAIDCLYETLYTIDELPLEVKLFSSEYERCFGELIILLHPFAPHITAELWEGLRTAKRLAAEDATRESHLVWSEDIFNQTWPKLDSDFEIPLRIQLKSHEQHQGNAEAEVQINKQSCVIHHPYGSVEQLTIDKAIELAVSRGVISRRDTVLNVMADNSKLVINENCGAELTLCEELYSLTGNKPNSTS